jgi:hypothetical protein
MKKKIKMKSLILLSKRQKRGLRGTERYHLKGTNIYLSGYEELSTQIRFGRTFYKREFTWEWFKFTGSSYGKFSNFEDFLENPDCPTELLFHMDIISNLK